MTSHCHLQDTAPDRPLLRQLRAALRLSNTVELIDDQGLLTHIVRSTGPSWVLDTVNAWGIVCSMTYSTLDEICMALDGCQLRLQLPADAI